MGNTKTTAITVRLPNELVSAIRSEAAELESSNSAVVARRLRRDFRRAQLVGNLDNHVSYTDEPNFLPEDDE